MSPMNPLLKRAMYYVRDGRRYWKHVHGMRPDGELTNMLAHISRQTIIDDEGKDILPLIPVLDRTKG